MEVGVEEVELLSGKSGSSCWWSGTGEQKEYGAEVCVHELIEEQVKRRGEAVAVVGGRGEQCTYGEMNRRANQLGRYLRKREE